MNVADHPQDKGDAIDVVVTLPVVEGPAPEFPTQYRVERCGERNGIYEKVAQAAPTARDILNGHFTIVVGKCIPGEPYWFRVAAVDPGPEGGRSATVAPVGDQPVMAKQQAFDGSRFWLLIIMLLVCGAILTFVILAWIGMPLKVRQIAGLEAIEEAVGRATEMGQSCLFVPGIQDMNEMQTIAGLTILSRVAERAAEYDCRLETPTSKSLVMTAARETVQNAFLTAGRPDAYNPDDIYYVSDEQFAYVSYITGKMVREKPAACFYLGSFFAESLILAETGNSIGAIQIAGTAQPAQLPFFVAACDYTLIGEEFFAASAYLSGAPDQLGSLKGQDVGKIIVAVLIIVGVTLVTLTQVTDSLVIADAANYLMDKILHAGG
ncbi:DUF6754 domain-containing protein [Planctomicrobium sp. SH661]|uniref:DUF6754 domain-containing protein n=1 Tax=Planctomicrobium sp. SH661 TaxID=3448124 RepID=UPI003F5C581E